MIRQHGCGSGNGAYRSHAPVIDLELFWRTTLARVWLLRLKLPFKAE